MQKKLLAVAVAGVLAAPAVAMAQSAVTISGTFKMGLHHAKIKDESAARAGAHKSAVQVTDHSSRLIFGVTEDLGGGMAGIAQIDMRFTPDLGALSAAGNTWVGLRSTSWGTITLGRHDLHYGKQPDDIASKAGALMAAAVSLMDFTASGTAIAGATRTNNVVRYDSPNWNGFAFTGAYSSNPTAVESDLTTSNDIRKGNAWNFNPSYTTGMFQVGFSHWRQRADGGGATADQRSNVLYGYYKLGALKIGAAMNRSKVEGAEGGPEVNKRTNWTVPVSWTSGRHNLYAHYTKAGRDKVIGDDSKANMVAAAYVYDLSKRTSVGITHARIKNQDAAAYTFFANAGASSSAGLDAGEDGQLTTFVVRHAF